MKRKSLEIHEKKMSYSKLEIISRNVNKFSNEHIVTPFLHSPLCRAEGLCQQAVIKCKGAMPNGPIRTKQVSQSSSVIG
jgi:hypothetical protein